MKKLLTAIKYLHHFLNDRPTPESEARDILQFLLLRTSTTHSIEIMQSLEEQFKAEMLRRKQEAEKVCRAINGKYIPEPVKPRVYDPNFDKSLNELEVEFN